ncbi:MAG TPA: phosphatidylserine decarboxylase [Tepidisphaeraceae bacterium]|jgi:phosphatidylserine decarboxylase|nr:phosphatidylserine decarboxylase [Tepidisphaeraceae bacterium]
MLPITRHGLREIVIGSIILAVIAAALGFAHWSLTLLVLPLWVWLLAFFRDPERVVPAEQHAMVSPADGKVTDITELDHVPELNGPGVRVGIFLSVFSVHINRAPCDGKVLAVNYKKGKFINAMSHNTASEHNESNTVVIGDALDGRPIATVKQIVGLIARRIICTVQPGQMVQRGQRIGMIKFGSRTELYIAKHLEPQVVVRVGQAVNGKKDVIAKVKAAIHATTTTVVAEPATSGK